MSSVDRVLKRHPQLQRFVSSASTLPGSPPVRQTANGPNSPIPGEPTEFSVLLVACGKAKSTVQVPFFETVDPAQGEEQAGPTPEVSQAISATERDYRARLAEVVDAARLPNDLPPAPEAMKATDLGETTGPKKPVLVRAFGHLGYDCRGGSGTFTLRRRAPANSTVEVYLDVGTWSRSLTATFRVYGLGFVARLPLPVSSRAIGSGQYPIGDAGRWQKIVENLAALVDELDRAFVPEIEGLSGPSPEWYRPES